jgi:hypothetical protein
MLGPLQSSLNNNNISKNVLIVRRRRRSRGIGNISKIREGRCV